MRGHMLVQAERLALVKQLECFLAGCFPIVQDHRAGQANSLDLSEALRVFPCRLFPHTLWPYAGLGE